MVLLAWGTPLFQDFWDSGGWPEIWFQSLFYKEPIGTRSLAIAGMLENKARQRRAMARGWPEPLQEIFVGFLKPLCFLGRGDGQRGQSDGQRSQEHVNRWMKRQLACLGVKPVFHRILENPTGAWLWGMPRKSKGWPEPLNLGNSRMNQTWTLNPTWQRAFGGGLNFQGKTSTANSFQATACADDFTFPVIANASRRQHAR